VTARLTWMTIIAVFALAVAGLMFYVFVRPAAQRIATGTITGKSFEDARTISRANASPRREDWTVSERKLPQGFLITIRLDDPAGEVRYRMERVAAQRFEVGERVSVRFEERGIPPLWSKRYVRDIAPVEPER
jgi:hypothetical protein